jgi:small redox-active disulfide protein 2
MEIKILGTGCSKCKVMESQVRRAVEQTQLDITVTKVQDYNQILAFGALSMPALVLDGAVRISGRIPPVEEIIKLITEQSEKK